MIQFVQAIRDHIDQLGERPFYLIPQNGEYVILEDIVPQDLAQSYLGIIDAIGVEDVFFYGELDENNSFNPDAERLQLLDDTYLAGGVPVYSVEYLTETGLIQQYLDISFEHSFIPYVSTRPLDTLFDGIELYPPLAGDVNFDGVVDVIDVLVVIAIITDNANPDEEILLAGDIIADGVLDILDIVALVAIILN
ncbi:MAG: hypothetical protein GXO91_04235 [FCB group bacterium]|nr:hypothetical protein [FCB group bacterium]